MERFRPDTWLDAFLRPFLLADPASFLYVEMIAPDFRFAFLALLGICMVVLMRRMQPFADVQVRAISLLCLTFYGWTFISGNGRYFLPGLMLVGSLLVVVIRHFPASRGFRVSLLALVAVIHGVVLVDFFRADPWRVTAWRNGPAIPLEESPLRSTPAVFLKVGSNSYSAITPHFHKESRWVMLGGHLRLDAQAFERKLLEAALDTKFPTYAMAPKDEEISDQRGQPIADIRRSINEILTLAGVRLTDADCAVVAIPPSGDRSQKSSRLGSAEGFWFCPVVRVAGIAAPAAMKSPVPVDRQQVFAVIEKACPRFFGPGSGLDTYFEGISRRSYPSTDMRLQVWADGTVSYQYFRSINFTDIGTLDQIMQGQVEVPCERLIGRYRPPWLSR